MSDFTLLAVVGCAAMSLYTGGLVLNLMLAPDALVAPLVMLCAPTFITHPDNNLNQN